jgi:uncharacterized membrane protein YhfC
MLNSGRLDTALGATLTPDALAHLRAGLQHLSIVTAAAGAVERLIAVLIQIGLSLVVWRAVQTRRPALLALAVILHAVIDFPVGLVQAGLLATPIAEGLLLVLGVALIVFFLRHLPRKGAAGAAPSA